MDYISKEIGRVRQHMLPGWRRCACAFEATASAIRNIEVLGQSRSFRGSSNDDAAAFRRPCTKVTDRCRSNVNDDVTAICGRFGGRFASPGVVVRRDEIPAFFSGHNCLQDTLDWNKIDCPEFLRLAKEVMVEDLFDFIITDKMYSKTGERDWDLNEFVLQRKDRRMFIGGQGIVLFVRRQGHSTSLAMKICYHRREEKKVERHVQRTILHLKAQGVSQFVGQILVNYLTRRFFITIMPKAKYASLKSLKQEHGPLSESSVRYYFGSIVSALLKLHAIRICHRDVKCDNVLIMHNGQPALIDFGLAVRGAVQVDEYKNSTRVTQMKYYPPETKLMANLINDYKIDAWLLGFFLCELIFNNRDHLWTKFKGNGHKDWVFAFCANCGVADNPAITAVLSKLLAADPKERAHVADVQFMPYMSEGGFLSEIEVMKPPMLKLESADVPERDLSES